MPAGRPTDYGPHVVPAARAYLEMPRGGDGEETIPTMEGLAMHLDTTRKTLYEWAKRDGAEEFRDILEKIHDKRGHMLITGGLKGAYNAAITKLMLSHPSHGYREATETDVTSKGERIALSDDRYAAILAEAAKQKPND